MLTVLLDTCVLYPAYLRDTLLRLAEAEFYQPAWSEDILSELGRNLIARTGEAKADRVADALRAAFPDALVFGYADLLPSMRNHPKDRHVLAAAIRCRAQVLLTANTKDFPPDSMRDHGIELLTPDDFLLDALDLDRRGVLRVLHEQVAAHRRPPRELQGLLERLSASAPRFAAEVRRAI